MRRPRFSFAALLAAVALSACDAFALKWAYSQLAGSASSPEGYYRGMVCLGLLPLANAALVALYLAASRPRGAEGGRGERPGVRPALSFALCATAGILAVVSLWSENPKYPKYLAAYFGLVGQPLGWVLERSGLVVDPADYERPLIRFVIDPLFMSPTLSGPPLLLAWIAARMARGRETGIRGAAKPRAAADPPRRGGFSAIIAYLGGVVR